MLHFDFKCSSLLAWYVCGMQDILVPLNYKFNSCAHVWHVWCLVLTTHKFCSLAHVWHVIHFGPYKFCVLMAILLGLAHHYYICLFCSWTYLWSFSIYIWMIMHFLAMLRHGLPTVFFKFYKFGAKQIYNICDLFILMHHTHVWHL